MPIRRFGLIVGIAMSATGCSKDQLKEAVYNAGAQAGCQQLQKNLPQEGLGQLECADPNASDRIDYRRYRVLREENKQEQF